MASINPADFVSVIDNPFFPLAPGTTFITKTPDGSSVDSFTVTRQTTDILGVSCVVVSDITVTDGQLEEKTSDFFAQDKDGNVWYFGETTATFEDGHVVSTDGTWRAGVHGAEPGIVMEAHPHVGDSYNQENATGVAEDHARVDSLDTSVTVPYGTFHHVLQTTETTPLEPTALEHKLYAAGIGFLEAVDTGNGDVEQLTEIRFEGTAGSDVLAGNVGTDLILGHGGDDTLGGLGGADTIGGSGGNDSIDGGAGNDGLAGGIGDDTVNGGSGDDFIDGGNGRDLLSGGTGNDVLFGGADDDTLRGGAGNDSLGSATGNDSIEGGAGDDEIRGGTGQDTLRGGTGADTLTGDAGRDTFQFQFHHGHQEAQGDTITDMAPGHDKLVFEGYAGGALANVGGDHWQLSYSDGGPASETFTITGVTHLTAGVDYEFV